MHIILACEANEKVGTGHVTRSYALAQALQRAGLTCTISGDVYGPAWLDHLIEQYRELNEPIELGIPDLVIIDSYVPELFDRVTRRFPGVPQIHIVDDSTPAREAVGYVEPGVNSHWTPPTACAQAPHIKGAPAVLIREELRSIQSLGDEKPAGTKLRVVVSLGGGDGYGLRSVVLNSLARIPVPMSIAVLSPEVIPIPASLVNHVSFIEPGAAIAEEIGHADVVISAAGVSSWEMLHQGIPTGLICAVDNQRANYDFMTREQLAIGLGDQCHDKGLDEVALEALLTDSELRRTMGKRAADLVDGRGADRAADMIMGILRALESDQEGPAS